MEDKKSITVSLWFGKFPTEKNLEKYVQVKNSKSTFWSEYKILHADPDFQEISWKQSVRTIQDLIEGCSYFKYY